jgi:HAD superfamily hydrolase (TIGR01509 family)
MTAAILFDLDGTLVDADHLHFEAWREILIPFGFDLTPDDYKRDIIGLPNALITANLLPQLAADAGKALADAKEERFRELASELEPAPGLMEFLAFIEAEKLKRGVVTNAPRTNAAHELGAIGLADHFEVLVIGDELAHGKPHPLPYLTGLAALGARAEISLAFEDSLSGLRSAVAAGLAVVGLTTSLPADALIEAGASLAIADFTDPRLTDFVKARTTSVH